MQEQSKRSVKPVGKNCQYTMTIPESEYDQMSVEGYFAASKERAFISQTEAGSKIYEDWMKLFYAFSEYRKNTRNYHLDSSNNEEEFIQLLQSIGIDQTLIDNVPNYYRERDKFVESQHKEFLSMKKMQES